MKIYGIILIYIIISPIIHHREDKWIATLFESSGYD